MNDKEFMAMLIRMICDYSINNDMNPDETLDTIAHNILEICKVASFRNWEGSTADVSGSEVK